MRRSPKCKTPTYKTSREKNIFDLGLNKDFTDATPKAKSVRKTQYI